MSRTLGQPVGQKRLTNVAVVRLKKECQGKKERFEIACYKNTVLSWRSAVEKDLNEVLQSQIVYSNVSKGILAKSKDLKAAFGMDDQTKICLEILDKGELQVAGKERESQLSNQFRDIATIVMQKTLNPETQHPYTISMIERLMHEIHFAVDRHSNSKKQALNVIRELQKHFPIKRSPMRVKLMLPLHNFSPLEEKLGEWKGIIVSKDESGSQLSIVCEMDPGLFRDCDALVRNLQGQSEILSVSVHGEGDINADYYDGHDDVSPNTSNKPTEPFDQSSQKLQKQTLAPKTDTTESRVKQKKCSTCDVVVGDDKRYREHFKSDWHTHNLKRKTRQLPPISAVECTADVELGDSKGNINEYNF